MLNSEAADVKVWAEGVRVAGGAVVRAGPGLVLRSRAGILPGSKWTGVCVAEQKGRQLAARQELNLEAVCGWNNRAGGDRVCHAVPSASS